MSREKGVKGRHYREGRKRVREGEKRAKVMEGRDNERREGRVISRETVKGRETL